MLEPSIEAPCTGRYRRENIVPSNQNDYSVWSCVGHAIEALQGVMGEVSPYAEIEKTDVPVTLTLSQLANPVKRLPLARRAARSKACNRDHRSLLILEGSQLVSSLDPDTK